MAESYWKLIATVTAIVWPALTGTGFGSPAAAPAVVFPSSGLPVKAAMLLPVAGSAQFGWLEFVPHTLKSAVATKLTDPDCVAMTLPWSWKPVKFGDVPTGVTARLQDVPAALLVAVHTFAA